jgi:2OG-Fe(II) oxygenase superfamily
MSLKKHPAFFSSYLDDFKKINTALLNGYFKHANNEDIKRSHYFEGRYENIYITKDSIPELNVIINAAIENAASILDTDKNNLKAGLWFNAMEPGHITLPHRHDDDDELLSAVYYISVPRDSGELTLRHKHFATQVTPDAGMFVFFPPDINHEVSRNNSEETRLSLGINIGPK